MALQGIGWVIRSKTQPELYGGHKARCKVFSSKRLALNSVRGTFISVARGNYLLPLAQNGRLETDEQILTEWDLLEVFVDTPLQP